MKNLTEKSTDELIAGIHFAMNKLYDKAWAGDKEAIVAISEIAKRSHGQIIDAMTKRLTQPNEPT